MMNRNQKLQLLFLPLTLTLYFIITLPGESQGNEKLVFQESFDKIGDNGLPTGWETWKPRNMEMLFEASNSLGYSGKHSYRMTGNGKYDTKGSLKKKIGGFEAGKYYKFNVYYTTRGIKKSINTKVLPVIKWGKGRNFEHIVPVEIKDGWFKAELIHQVPEDSNGEITVERFAGGVAQPGL